MAPFHRHGSAFFEGGVYGSVWPLARKLKKPTKGYTQKRRPVTSLQSKAIPRFGGLNGRSQNLSKRSRRLPSPRLAWKLPNGKGLKMVPSKHPFDCGSRAYDTKTRPATSGGLAIVAWAQALLPSVGLDWLGGSFQPTLSNSQN